MRKGNEEDPNELDYKCPWEGCNYEAGHKSHVARHIRACTHRPKDKPEEIGKEVDKLREGDKRKGLAGVECPHCHNKQNSIKLLNLHIKRKHKGATAGTETFTEPARTLASGPENRELDATDPRADVASDLKGNPFDDVAHGKRERPESEAYDVPRYQEQSTKSTLTVCKCLKVYKDNNTLKAHQKTCQEYLGSLILPQADSPGPRPRQDVASVVQRQTIPSMDLSVDSGLYPRASLQQDQPREDIKDERSDVTISRENNEAVIVPGISGPVVISSQPLDETKVIAAAAVNRTEEDKEGAPGSIPPNQRSRKCKTKRGQLELEGKMFKLFKESKFIKGDEARNAHLAVGSALDDPAFDYDCPSSEELVESQKEQWGNVLMRDLYDALKKGIRPKPRVYSEERTVRRPSPPKSSEGAGSAINDKGLFRFVKIAEKKYIIGHDISEAFYTTKEEGRKWGRHDICFCAVVLESYAPKCKYERVGSESLRMKRSKPILKVDRPHFKSFVQLFNPGAHNDKKKMVKLQCFSYNILGIPPELPQEKLAIMCCFNAKLIVAKKQYVTLNDYGGWALVDEEGEIIRAYGRVDENYKKMSATLRESVRASRDRIGEFLAKKEEMKVYRSVQKCAPWCDYDVKAAKVKAAELEATLSEEQSSFIEMFEKTLADRYVYPKRPNVYLLTGSAGTGKTRTVKSIIADSEAKARGPYCVVCPTHLAATNYERATTVHSRFGIKFTPRWLQKKLKAGKISRDERNTNLEDLEKAGKESGGHEPFKRISNNGATSMNEEEKVECKIDARTKALLCNLRFIIVDEAMSTDKDMLEAVNNTLKPLHNPNHLFGGLPTLLVGDPNQLFPINRPGTDTASATIDKLPWYNEPGMVKKFELRTNMRAKDDPELVALLDKIRSSDFFTIPERCKVKEFSDLIDFVYSDIASRFNEENYYDGLAVLCSKKCQARKINSKVLGLIPGESKSFECKRGGVKTVLTVKVGCLLLCLNKIHKGVFNGIHLKCVGFKDDSITVVVLTGTAKGEIINIKGRRARGENAENNVGLSFPVVLAFAMTIHKAQGQTLNKVGVNLKTEVFASGQAYTAFSRVRKLEHIKAYSPRSTEPTKRDSATINEICRLFNN